MYILRRHFCLPADLPPTPHPTTLPFPLFDVVTTCHHGWALFAFLLLLFYIFVFILCIYLFYLLPCAFAVLLCSIACAFYFCAQCSTHIAGGALVVVYVHHTYIWMPTYPSSFSSGSSLPMPSSTTYKTLPSSCLLDSTTLFSLPAAFNSFHLPAFAFVCCVYSLLLLSSSSFMSGSQGFWHCTTGFLPAPLPTSRPQDCCCLLLLVSLAFVCILFYLAVGPTFPHRLPATCLWNLYLFLPSFLPCILFLPLSFSPSISIIIKLKMKLSIRI